ncbi:MAG: PEP-CTERM sorting domain-containing protein [Isosphaeraceae bacterium]
MKKHRGLFLAFGLLGLLGMLPQAADAGTITMTISWSGGSITIKPGTAFAQTGSSNTQLTVNTSALNNTLKTDHVNLSFSGLGASTQNGSLAYPTSGLLSENGTIAYAANGGTINTVSISTSLSGFTAPTGTGTIDSSTTVNMQQTNAGDSQGASTSYNNSTVTTFSPYTSTGSTNQTPAFTPVMKSVGTVASGYELDNSATIKLTAGQDQFSVATQLTAQSVPEPTSIILMLTSMPLPLVVMGLIRRRRRAVAA